MKDYLQEGKLIDIEIQKFLKDIEEPGDPNDIIEQSTQGYKRMLMILQRDMNEDAQSGIVNTSVLLRNRIKVMDKNYNKSKNGKPQILGKDKPLKAEVSIQDSLYQFGRYKYGDGFLELIDAQVDP